MTQSVPNIQTDPRILKDVQSLERYFNNQHNRVYLGRNGHLYTQMSCTGLFSALIKLINGIARKIWGQKLAPDDAYRRAIMDQAVTVIIPRALEALRLDGISRMAMPVGGSQHSSKNDPIISLRKSLDIIENLVKEKFTHLPRSEELIGLFESDRITI